MSFCVYSCILYHCTVCPMAFSPLKTADSNAKPRQNLKNEQRPQTFFHKSCIFTQIRQFYKIYNFSIKNTCLNTQFGYFHFSFIVCMTKKQGSFGPFAKQLHLPKKNRILKKLLDEIFSLLKKVSHIKNYIKIPHI